MLNSNCIAKMNATVNELHDMINGGNEQMTSKQRKVNQMIAATAQLQTAFKHMNDAYDEHWLMEYFSSKYPFGYNFCELVNDVNTWCDELIENLVDELQKG